MICPAIERAILDLFLEVESSYIVNEIIML
jgi:hypothetical protein